MRFYNLGYGSGMTMTIEVAIGVIAAIVLSVLICIFILPEKKREGLNPFFQWLHDQVNFRVLWIEKILKVLYIIATMFCVCIGFFLLFGVTFLFGLLLIVVGIFITRITYEFLLLQILILKNTRQINEKMDGRPAGPLKGLDPEAPEQKYSNDYSAPVFEDEVIEPEEPEVYVPEYRYCSKCGTRYDRNKGGCPNGCR